MVMMMMMIPSVLLKIVIMNLDLYHLHAMIRIALSVVPHVTIWNALTVLIDVSIPIVLGATTVSRLGT